MNRSTRLLAAFTLVSAPVTAQIFAHVEEVPSAVALSVATERAQTPSIRASEFVRIDPLAVLAQLQAARRLDFRLNGKNFRAVVEGFESSLGHYRLHGRVEGGSFAMAFGRHALAAQLDLDGTTIQVRSTGVDDLHVAYVHDPRKFEENCGQAASHVHEAGGNNGPLATPLATGDVDVMVFYTALARTNAGGKAAMDAEVHLRIDLANVANKASSVPWRWRLVHAGETAYVEPNPVRLVPILNRFVGTSDGYMDEVHGLRTRYGGDVMALICDGQNRDWGGYARCRSSRSTAFSLTHRAGLVSHLLHHEMGHNLGLAHNRANVDCRGSYSYSYGWRTPDNKFHTVMSYAGGTPRSVRINAWSSPKVKHQTYTMGTATDDNARTLVNRGPIVARFSPTRTHEWLRLHGGIKGLFGIPVLLGSGTTHALAPPMIGFRGLVITAPGVLLIGGSAVDWKLFGGVLVPSPDIAIPVSSNSSFDASFLNRLPTGTWVWFQAFFVNSFAVQGWAATHGFKVQAL